MTSTATGSVTGALRAVVHGAVVGPADTGYDRARQVWNGAVDRRPAGIVACTDGGDVVRAVRAAREHDLPVSVRGGGHDWAGRALRDGGVVLDLSAMGRVTVDPATATAEIQGGVRAGELVAAAHRHGFTAVTGTVGAVGVVGLTLGGGYGLLNGRYGLALDNLLEARVVLADGSEATAGAEENPDLFWALRGGGGNFGIVTAARYRVHPARAMLSGLLMFPFLRAGDVLRRHRDLIGSAPDELTAMTGFFCGPDGAPVLFVLPLFAGDPAGHDAAADRMRGLGAPLMGTRSAMTCPEVIAISDASVVDGRHSEVDTRWLPALTDGAIDRIVDAGRSVTSPYSALFVHHFHGASTRPAVSDTAFALRQEHLLVEIVATWLPGAAGGGDAHRRWARTLSAELAGDALPGGYANLLGPGDQDRVLAGYGPNAGRLLALKQRFDPDGVLTAVPTLPVPTATRPEEKAP